MRALALFVVTTLTFFATSFSFSLLSAQPIINPE